MNTDKRRLCLSVFILSSVFIVLNTFLRAAQSIPRRVQIAGDIKANEREGSAMQRYRLTPKARTHGGGSTTARLRADRLFISPLETSSSPKQTTAWPPVKNQLTIRLDADVAWLKGHAGLPDAINRILRVVMESQPPRPAP